MRSRLSLGLIVLATGLACRGCRPGSSEAAPGGPRLDDRAGRSRLPGSSIRRPSSTAPDGTVYLGQDPMDMPGPPDVPADSVVAIRDGKITVFADKLWSVMGLEWVDGTLYVVHAPYLSAFRDTDGDGKADERVDLITGLGPKLPGLGGINDHIAAGIRLGMDGFLYIAVGDKGIPRGRGQGRADDPAPRRRRDPDPARRDRAWKSSRRASGIRSRSPSARPARSSPTATTTTARSGPTA